jgi:hypothetical protein
MSLEAMRVWQKSVEVVRELGGKNVLKNSGTHQNVLVLFQSF